jgi:hypothetical protein
MQVTVVDPRAKSDPDAGLQRGVRGELSVSDAVTLKLTYAPRELVASAMLFVAPSMVGDPGVPPGAGAV